MKAFSARLVFEMKVGEVNAESFDEQTLVIFADKESTAFAKAIAYGRKENETFVNPVGKTVHWNFLGVSELEALQPNDDAVFVHGRTVSPGRYSHFGHRIKKQASQLAAKFHPLPNMATIDH